MNIPKLQAELQSILDANPRPRHGYEEIVMLDAIEQCNKTCLDFMETFNLDKVDYKPTNGLGELRPFENSPYPKECK